MEALLLQVAKKTGFESDKVKAVFTKESDSNYSGNDVLNDFKDSSNDIYADVSTNSATQEFYNHVENIDYNENLNSSENKFEVTVKDTSSNPAFEPLSRTISLDLKDRTIKEYKVSDFEWGYDREAFDKEVKLEAEKISKDSNMKIDDERTQNLAHLQTRIKTKVKLNLYCQNKKIDGIESDFPVHDF